MLKRFSAFAAAVVLILLLCSCGMSASDAQTYVKGHLDSVYLNIHSEKYLELTGLDISECKNDYAHGIEQEVEYFLSYAQIEGVSDETVERINRMYRQIYPHSKYEVGEVTKGSDRIFVNVTIYPIDVIVKAYDNGIEAFTEEFGRRADAGEFDDISDAEREELWADGIISAVEAQLDSVGYLEPVTISAQIIEEDGYYVLSEDDLRRIDELIIQY